MKGWYESPKDEYSEYRMSVSHHLTDETLQDYAVGSLSAPMETLVACHLTVCSHCRQRAILADQIGGDLFEQFDSAKVSLSATDVLQRAGAAAPSAHKTETIAVPAVKGVPRPLARILPTDLEQLDWKRIAPGIKQINLSEQHRRNGAFKLLHLAPGVVLSAHSHNDRELTYVVQGSYQDEIGRFKAGDIADLDGEVAHQPVVDTDQPCIALIASESPVKYNGLFGKIMQPIVGI